MTSFRRSLGALPILFGVLVSATAVLVAQPQRKALRTKTCDATSCVTSLTYAGNLQFTSDRVRLTCVKDTQAFNGWPGHVCTLTGAGPHTYTIAHLCGSRDCQWQSESDDVLVYGERAPSMDDLVPGDSLEIRTPKY